jgi:murein L,D-transpeptidase YcbB/YkuD
VSASAAQAVDAFYATRGGAPLWLRSGADSGAARELIGVLERAPLDGFASGPIIAAQAQALMTRAQARDAAALRDADRLLSLGWVSYVQKLQRPPTGMIYADPAATPHALGASQILGNAADAQSLLAHVRHVSQVNPLYAQLRDAAWAQMQANGGSVDPRVLASLDRARETPTADKYIMVDAAAARLYMIEDGRIVDSMKVAVGKADAATQTPLNPYWHVGGEMVRSLTAKNVLEQGVSYLKTRGYQVLDPATSEVIDPSTVDWQAVRDGREQVAVRQLPGPANSMGRMKFGFPNSQDIYLHDTPVKALFSQEDRDISHGCVRLQDAERLAHWMFGRDPEAGSSAPEQHVQLPAPVPIYMTYLTAQARDGQLAFVDDIYGRDTQAMQVAALR